MGELGKCIKAVIDCLILENLKIPTLTLRKIKELEKAWNSRPEPDIEKWFCIECKQDNNVGEECSNCFMPRRHSVHGIKESDVDTLVKKYVDEMVIHTHEIRRKYLARRLRQFAADLMGE